MTNGTRRKSSVPPHKRPQSVCFDADVKRQWLTYFSQNHAAQCKLHSSPLRRCRPPPRWQLNGTGGRSEEGGIAEESLPTPTVSRTGAALSERRPAAGAAAESSGASPAGRTADERHLPAAFQPASLAFRLVSGVSAMKIGGEEGGVGEEGEARGALTPRGAEP